MMGTSGNQFDLHSQNFHKQQAAAVDKNYMVIGSVDESLRHKIINHEYVDFARLLPKDKISAAEDNRMELVSKGGSTFFVPVADHEVAGGINGFNHWEQAFRVFSNVYTKIYPERATELIQYNQLIYTAPLSFVWEKVYRYDKDFCMHLSNFPQRSWSVILQQAWTLYLKDRISQQPKSAEHGFNPGQVKKKEECKRFNKGKCNKGFHCQYEHRCLICGKFGHRAHICHNRKHNGSDAKLTSKTDQESKKR